MSGAEGKSFVGRTLVFTLFGTVVIYFGVAIIGSIVSDLYGHPPPDESGALSVRERTWCIRSIVGLRDELEGQVTLELQHPKRDGDPTARWTLWREGWRSKLGAARARCVNAGNQVLDHAYGQLFALEEGYGTTVDSMIRTRSTVSPSLLDALTELKKQR